MQTIKWYRMLAVGTLALPIAGPAQGPQPKFTEITTIPGIAVDMAVRMPNGKVILYATYDDVTGSIFAYDLASKRSTLVTRGFDGNLSITRAGDRLAYNHESEDGKTDLVWSIPISPATGAATGPAQRVSMGQGDVASFSPDGKSIAFRGKRGGGVWELAVVPTAGGTERVLAHYDRTITETAWSANGKFIFVEVIGRVADSTRTVERVPVAGGASEHLIKYWGPIANSPPAEGQLNGEVAFYRPDPNAITQGRMAYVTASGVRGEFALPKGAEPGWGLAPPALLIKTTRPSTSHHLTLATGTVRDLLPGAMMSRGSVWSPDGRRIAVEDATGGSWGITVMNADGSQPQRHPVSVKTPAPMKWSPNGELLAYIPADRPTTLAILEVGTGRSRDVFKAVRGGFRDYTWRPDGKSFVVVTQMPDGYNEIHEAELDGTQRMLRAIDTELPGYITGGFISDRELIAGNPSGGGRGHFVVPTAGGTVRSFPRGGTRNAWFGVSNDGNRLLFLLRNADGRVTSIELVNASGDSLRTLSLPFEVDRRTIFPPFLPDGRSVILVGKTPGDSVSRIFLVPLNGDAPRALGTLPGRLTNDRLSLSSNGKALLFTTEGAPSSTIYDLDLTPVLQAIRKP